MSSVLRRKGTKMLEIGSSLREARRRRGLELAAVEHDLKIRTSYVQALEEERFDRLPGDAYRRILLREYADYLGLDGQLFLDEYTSRFDAPEEEMPIEPPRLARSRRRWGSRQRLALPGLALLVALAVGAVLLNSSNGSKTSTPLPPLAHTAPKKAVHRPAAKPKPAPSQARLVVRATNGPCWIAAHAGAETGRLLWVGMLEPGQAVHLAGKSLWLRLGAPWNLEAHLNGRILVMPADTGNVLVTASGLRTVA